MSSKPRFASSPAGPRKQDGATLLLTVLIIIVALTALIASAFSSWTPISLSSERPTAESLRAAKKGLLLWAGKRISTRALPNHSDTPPGLLPHSDRNRDGNYDGQSDCPSAAADLDNGDLRLGRLPSLGWTLPCREDLKHTQGMAIGSLHHTDVDGELLWYATAKAIVDQPTGDYPDTSPLSLMSQSAGWLIVCDQQGHLLTDRAAFVVIAPGKALAGQERNEGAPDVEHFLDRHPLNGPAPCDNPHESNADGNRVFVARGASSSATFNDTLVYVTHVELASEVATALAQLIGHDYLLAYFRLHGRFPFAAAADTSKGVCVDGLLRGRLALPNEACPGLPPLPRYLDEPSDLFYRNTRYRLAEDGKTAQVRFDGCSMVFEIGAAGLKFFPRQC